MRAFLVAALLLLVGVAHADVYRRAAFMRHVVGTGISTSTNVQWITNPSTGTYVVQLASGCEQALGVVNVTTSRADGACFGDFTAIDQITVTCRTAAANALVNVPNGTIVVLVAYCAVP